MSLLASSLSGAGTLLGFLAGRVPNQEAIELSPTVGWWTLFGVACLLAVFFLQSDRWRRWWLTTEDPRTIGLFRLVFGFFVIANVNGLWEFFTYLFTDEGIFTADVARQVFASHQFAGFGDGFTKDEPWGFFDLAAFMQMMTGPKYSLLYIWDTPQFLWGYLIAFEIVAICFMIGFKTRIMGILTWLLMNGLFVRNHLFWEGTELVYRTMLAYLVLARAGHAYSVDNWLRCRKLRKQGLLSEPGGPGGGAGLPPSPEHPEGLAAIYRRIPVWPRRLLMLQLATIYTTTGLLKTGNVWMHGDSLYYALNLDHFYRFPPQFTSSLFGTNVFRALVWMVKIGQSAFPLVILGLVLRWVRYQPPLDRRRIWALRAAFVGLIATSAAITWIVWPVHFTPPVPRGAFVAGWVGLWVGVWALLWKLTYRPWRVSSIAGRKLARTYVLDRDWFCRWFLGRRVWLLWHIGFHAHIFSLMNVGQFQTGMLSSTIPFLEGYEVATFGRLIGRRLARLGIPGIPASVARGEPPIPTESLDLPQHRRDRALVPDWALAVAFVLLIASVVARSLWGTDVSLWWFWSVALAVVSYGAWREGQRAQAEKLGPSPVAWAYGPFGRLFVGTLTAWHLAAVAIWLMPNKDVTKSFRGPARKVVSKWLTVTATDQGWGMFAPNPPRSNIFLKILVTDEKGEVWDLRSDVYAEEQKPIPWIWNTRLRKMNRRIIGGESGPTQWYRKWHARYICRKWQMDHNGEIPKKVELVKVWYRIPTPEQVRDRGYYIPEELLARAGHEKVEYTEYCKNAVMGQLPNWIRERHGLPPLPEGVEYRPWIKHKKRKWERRQQAKARKAAATKKGANDKKKGGK